MLSFISTPPSSKTSECEAGRLRWKQFWGPTRSHRRTCPKPDDKCQFPWPNWSDTAEGRTPRVVSLALLFLDLRSRACWFPRLGLSWLVWGILYSVATDLSSPLRGNPPLPWTVGLSPPTSTPFFIQSLLSMDTLRPRPRQVVGTNPPQCGLLVRRRRCRMWRKTPLNKVTFIPFLHLSSRRNKCMDGQWTFWDIWERKRRIWWTVIYKHFKLKH